MDEIERAVREAILEVARERDPEIPGLEDRQRLHADLGLKSIDLARVIAVLELELDRDPFAEQVSITSVRTVGDLIGAYRGEAAGDAARQAVEAGERRAAARRGGGDGS